MTRRERQGYLWILLAAAGFSVMPTMVKSTYMHSSLQAMDIAIWRFLLAAPAMWVLVWLMRSRTSAGSKSDVPVRAMLLIGLVISAAVVTAFFALERLPASTYIVLFFSYPAMVVVLSSLLGERIPPVAWLALALALTGIVLTVPDFNAEGGADGLGVALVLINAAIVAVYYLLTKRAMHGVADVSGASAWMMLGSLAVFLLLIPLRGLMLPPNPLTLLLLLGIAIVGTVLPVFAVNLAIQRIGAAQTSLVSTVEPIMSMIVSMLILGEVIFAVQWLGAALIVCSVIILQIRPRDRIDMSIAHEAG